MSETAKLTRGSIVGHLVGQTAPMIIGVAAIMSVGLIDAYFIGQLGSQELAAVSFIFPITIALSSLGVGVMVGINSVIARALGEGDVERAERRANFGAIFALVVGVVMGLALFLLLDPLFRLMQASDALLPLIRAYMQPYSLGLPVLLLQMGLNGVLRGQGEARKTSYVSITYSVANWILDPILITGAFGFAGFGIAGAAYASIAGFAIAILVALYLIKSAQLHINPASIRRCNVGESSRAIISVAGPAAFSNAINPIGLSVLTALLASQGEAAVAGFGAAGRLQSFATVPLLALSGSIGAIVGQNWGARHPDRSRAAMLYSAGFCVVYGLATAILLYFTGGWFAQFFTDDPAVVAEFESYLEIAVWGYAGFGLLIVANGALNAVDRAGLALTQSAARVFLVMLPFGWLLRSALGAEAIYGAELVANIAGGILASLIVWRVLRSGPET
ncbi:MATE family efflux transporter [Qipengyuania nanhaisediminis]|uniref:Putative efflux protein, MATE family n=1 Tax=Qipengyuania nanhaisediminis TaxID=604088 RepID=A0A1I5LIF0_9SPHN|nr:MATE family efflux transporter [Qipengyuania nanhaisediminis]SFO97139.1 putative efflux protein, MATE family [Qipengyuania nanhaisediminis]